MPVSGKARRSDDEREQRQARNRRPTDLSPRFYAASLKRKGYQTRMAYDVFLSHAAEDKPAAQKVCDTLERRQIHCWIAPRDIAVGEEWDEAIVKGIKQCRILLLIFSSRANQSPHVRRELALACDQRKKIIPFRVEDVLPTGSVEFYIQSHQWMDAFTPPLEQHVGRLSERVIEVLNEPERSFPNLPAAPTGRPKLSLRAWGALAAALLLIATVGISLRPKLRHSSPPTTEAASLPQPSATINPWQAEYDRKQNEAEVAQKILKGSLDNLFGPIATGTNAASPGGTSATPTATALPELPGKAASAKDKAAIEAAYRELADAIAKKDFEKFKAAHAPEFTNVRENGRTTNFDSFMNGAMGMFIQGPKFEGIWTVHKVVAEGSQATAMVSCRIVMTPQGSGPMTLGDETDLDVWKRTDAGWLRTQTKALRLEIRLAR